jgi:hypothetical protein
MFESKRYFQQRNTTQNDYVVGQMNGGNIKSFENPFSIKLDETKSSAESNRII